MRGEVRARWRGADGSDVFIYLGSRRRTAHTRAETQTVQGLLKLPKNRYCSECGASRPLWASPKLGCFFCLRCSGIHRNLGVHISFVRSVSLDTWTPEQARELKVKGNVEARRLYEANVPPSYDVPDEHSPVPKVEKWIRDKYERRLFVNRDGSLAPPMELPRQIAKQEGAGFGDASSSASKPRRVAKARQKGAQPSAVTAQPGVPKAAGVSQTKRQNHSVRTG